MSPEPIPLARARRAALVLLAMLALVTIVRLLIGLPAIVFFGLTGGLISSLIIVGLDLLHNAARRLDGEDGDPPGGRSRR